MPKRTNEFQQLVYSIQHQLAVDAIVTESMMLKDKRTGAKVEVDITIETSVGDVPFTIGIECTKETRPATVEWVHEMRGKHADLPIDKTVLVSKGGFSKKAVNKAIALGVETISIDEANSANWKKFVDDYRDLILTSFKFIVIACKVTSRTPNTDGKTIKISRGSVISGLSTDYTLEKYCRDVIHSQSIIQYVQTEWLKTPKEKRNNKFKVIYRKDNFANNVTIKDDEEIMHKLKDLEVEVEVGAGTTPLELKYGEFKKTHVAYAVIENVFKTVNNSDEKMLITLLGKEGQLHAGGLMLLGDKSCSRQIYPLKIPGENEPQL